MPRIHTAAAAAAATAAAAAAAATSCARHAFSRRRASSQLDEATTIAARIVEASKVTSRQNASDAQITSLLIAANDRLENKRDTR